jgi:HEAT repeat protein
VLQFVAGPPPGGAEYRSFQREVEATLTPNAIRKELKGGNYVWGSWLAFLRPHEDLVPVLLTAVSERPEELPETILALGNSGDPRALDTLLKLLKSDDYRTAGDAALALRYLADSKAEQPLVETLKRPGWPQLQACLALGKLGTKAALPALEKIAADDSYMGALSVRDAARESIRSITQRSAR